MSVSSVYVREIAQGDGVNTVFGFPWKFVAAPDLMVYVDDVLQPASAYEVKTPITKDRGEIVFRTAPAVGAVVVIRRMDNQQQTRLFKNQENFNAHEVEKAFDKLTLLVQEGFEELRRGALRMQSQSNLDYTIESLTIDDGMLALDLANKTYKQTSFTQAQVQKVIDDAVRSADLSVKNMEWDGDALVVSFSDGSTKKGVASGNVAQIRAQHDDNNRWWLEWSLDGKVWQGIGGISGGSVHNNLIERDAPDAHPISAISGLQTALSAKADSADVYTKTEVDTALLTKADTTTTDTLRNDVDGLGDQVHGIEEKIPAKASTTNQLVTMSDVQQAGGLSEVVHDDTLAGTGTAESPLSVKTDDFVKKSSTEMQTISSPLTVKEEICLTDPDDNVAKHSLSIVAGIPTETAAEMDIIGNRKYDTLPTADDTTSYENLAPQKLITKGQVATGIAAAIVPLAVVPAGTVVAYAGSKAPAGYLICDGSAVSRTTYYVLFAVIGTTYGAGDGNSTFNLPHIVGRTIFGMAGKYIGKTTQGVLPNIKGSVNNVQGAVMTIDSNYGKCFNESYISSGWTYYNAANPGNRVNINFNAGLHNNIYGRGWYDGGRVVPASVGMMYIIKY